MIALPICAHQLNVDTVRSGGIEVISSEYGHFIIHHFHSGKQKNPDGERMMIIILSTD